MGYFDGISDDDPRAKDERLKWLQQTLSQMPDVTSYEIHPPPVMDPHNIDVAAIHAAWQARHDAEILLARRQAIEAEIAELQRGELLRTVRPAFDVGEALQSFLDNEIHWALGATWDVGVKAQIGINEDVNWSPRFRSVGEATAWLLRTAIKRYPANPGVKDWQARLGEQDALASTT